jgi:hypothetical protein
MYAHKCLLFVEGSNGALGQEEKPGEELLKVTPTELLK